MPPRTLTEEHASLVEMLSFMCAQAEVDDGPSGFRGDIGRWWVKRKKHIAALAAANKLAINELDALVHYVLEHGKRP